MRKRVFLVMFILSLFPLFWNGHKNVVWDAIRRIYRGTRASWTGTFLTRLTPRKAPVKWVCDK